MRKSSKCSSTASSTATDGAGTRARGAARARRGQGVAAALLVAALGAGTARAHSPAAPVTRELLRLQGHKQEGGDCGGRSVLLSALGRSAAFCADEYRRLALATDKPIELEEQPVAIDLQGSRALLSRFTKARREQKITVLGEWRPGRRDLFLIAVDLCPEE